MKKILLLASMAALGFSAMAGVDPVEYPEFDGFTMKNIWLNCLNHDEAAWKAYPIASDNYARTSALAKDYVYIAQSKQLDSEGLLTDVGSLIEIEFLTGKYVRTIQLTVDGKPLEGLLCANQVGCDDAGNIWVCGYLASTYVSNAEDPSNNGGRPIRPYVVDLETGACTLAGELTLPDDEADAAGRIDYFHVVGDITGETSRGVLMAPIASGSDLFVYGWAREQGEDWAPMMGGGDYVSQSMSESYPADQTSWGTAPTVTIIRDEEFSGELFYVDGFTTAPALYNTEGTMYESFASAPDLAPALGANGVGEFNIGGTDFLAYVKNQYDTTPGCQIRIVKLGEDQSFEGMELAYSLPDSVPGSFSGGLGQLSDGGTRVHNIATRVVKDNAGKEGALILTHKCANGIGVYLMAEAGFNDADVLGTNGVNNIATDNNAAVEYFNLQGQRVNAANLEKGIYITRQGSKSQKVIVK